MQSQYAGLCKGCIIYRIRTLRDSPALCYTEQSLFILDGFRHRHVPMSMVTGAELFTLPRRRSRYDMVLIEHIAGSEPDLMLRLKYRDGEGESEVEFTLEEHGFEKPETVKLMLLPRESGCDASPYVKN